MLYPAAIPSSRTFPMIQIVMSSGGCLAYREHRNETARLWIEFLPTILLSLSDV
jgi:hypothetical protein